MGRLIAALALLAALPAHAQMYKCVDERGVTHYSDKPRPGCKGGKVDIQGSPPISGAVKPPADGDFARQGADFKRRQMERERVEAADKAALDERCTRVKREYAIYSHGGRIARIDSGERVYIDDAAREAKLAQLREQMRGCP